MSMPLLVWYPESVKSLGLTQDHLERLGHDALKLGATPALSQWQQAAEATGASQSPSAANPLKVAHVHGERHDLWWEFTLEASFRWQGHLHRLRPEIYQQRLHRLTRQLGLEGLLQREVASLTHSSRVLADLAVALLPQPDLLLWEEPFYLLGHADAARAVACVHEQHLEGMALVAIATEPPGLSELATASQWHRQPFHVAQ